MADRSYIAGGVSGHPGGCDSANRHRQVPGWEPPMDVTMFWGRNANERDEYRATGNRMEQPNPTHTRAPSGAWVGTANGRHHVLGTKRERT
jgi:hypothetical protein